VDLEAERKRVSGC